MKNKTLGSPNYFLFSGEKKSREIRLSCTYFTNEEIQAKQNNVFLLKWQFASAGSFISY